VWRVKSYFSLSAVSFGGELGEQALDAVYRQTVVGPTGCLLAPGKRWSAPPEQRRSCALRRRHRD
jgi:hypothetical protein